MVRQRATSRSSVQLVQAFVVFRILSVTSSLTHALSQSLAHAQQFFSSVHARPNISAEGLHFSAFHCSCNSRAKTVLWVYVEGFSLLGEMGERYTCSRAALAGCGSTNSRCLHSLLDLCGCVVF